MEAVDCLEQKSLRELRLIASALGVSSKGNRRWKKTWIRAIENSFVIETDCFQDFLTSSDSWNPADFGEVFHKADANGQLNLFEWDVEEPPDPDDFESLDAFREAMDLWDSEHCEPIDSEHCEPIELSLASLCYWAPCPEEWWVETSSSTLEIFSESIAFVEVYTPKFFNFSDRNSEDPLTAGVCARFLPTAVKIAVGRSPPGGDAVR